jgi:hypothetical protein
MIFGMAGGCLFLLVRGCQGIREVEGGGPEGVRWQMGKLSKGRIGSDPVNEDEGIENFK